MMFTPARSTPFSITSGRKDCLADRPAGSFHPGGVFFLEHPFVGGCWPVLAGAGKGVSAVLLPTGGGRQVIRVTRRLPFPTSTRASSMDVRDRILRVLVFFATAVMAAWGAARACLGE
jgi:hypothetical protein